MVVFDVTRSGTFEVKETKRFHLIDIVIFFKTTPGCSKMESRFRHKFIIRSNKTSKKKPEIVCFSKKKILLPASVCFISQ